jgi:hypothetical protein
MKRWVNFLHLYQPPTQDLGVVRRIVDESYTLIASLLERHPRAVFTMNVSGSLLEHFHKHGHDDLIERYRRLAEQGRIELVGSAMYHPILPLLSATEVRRQIELNERALERAFGDAYKRRGFFMPEMAYSDEAAAVVKDMGFAWVILDQAHYDGAIDPSVRYVIEGNGLQVMFRDRGVSKSFVPQTMCAKLDALAADYVVSAHDGEMYGHWHRDDNGFYAKAFEHPAIEMVSGSDYLAALSREEAVSLRPANWEASEREIAAGVPYHLWDDPRNEIHAGFWALLRYAIDVVGRHQDDPNFAYARDHLDRALASCSLWWASNAKPDVLSPITWNPSEIEKGLLEAIKSVRSLHGASAAEKVEAERQYARLLAMIWQRHWEEVAKPGSC